MDPLHAGVSSEAQGQEPQLIDMWTSLHQLGMTPVIDSSYVFASELVHFVMNIFEPGAYDGDAYNIPGTRRIFNCHHCNVIMTFVFRMGTYIQQIFHIQYSSFLTNYLLFGKFIKDLYDYYALTPCSELKFIHMCAHMALCSAFAKGSCGLINAPICAIHYIQAISRAVNIEEMMNHHYINEWKLVQDANVQGNFFL